MVTYIKYPDGYPQMDYRVRRAGRKWRVEAAEWQTATNHTGYFDTDDTYRTRRAAEAAVERFREEDAARKSGSSDA